MKVDSEHRGLARVPVQQTVLVRDILRNIEVGRIVNLHEEGFMLIGGNEVKENRLYQLIFLLSEPFAGKSEMSIGAECLWTRETVGDDRSWAGFSILDVSSDDLKIISRLTTQFDL